MNVISKTIVCFVTLVSLFAFAQAQRVARLNGRMMHIRGGRRASRNWRINDGKGYRWDFSSQGSVNDGTNDAYDGGMILSVNGSNFSYHSYGRLSKNGREIEIGPWNRNSIRVHRRIYVDPKLGYCRWIDIFENTSGTTQTVPLQYYTNMGGSIRRVYTTCGKSSLTKKDWGFVTCGSSNSSSRPALVHVFASKGSKIKPVISYTRNSDTFYYRITLKIPAGKTQAICLFEAQRRPYQKAEKFLKSFNPNRELGKVPYALRKIIVNMGHSMLSVGCLELQRHEKLDMVILRNGNELLGTITNKTFVMETSCGKLELSAKQIIGMSVPVIDDTFVHVGLTDGQIIGGTFVNAPLVIRLINGSSMSVPMSKLKTAAYCLSPTRPTEIALRRPAIVLRSGEQFFFNIDDFPGIFHTEYGDMKLDLRNLRSIEFDTEDSGLHRAVFRNGSCLSGLLDAKELKFNLDFKLKLSIPRQFARRIVIPGKTIESNLSVIKLKNEDVLLGRIANEMLVVQTTMGNVSVKPQAIATMVFNPQATGSVDIKLHTGTSVSGKFIGKTIDFQIEPGPKLPVFIGHIQSITCPKPPPAPKNPATPAIPATPAKPSTRPITLPKFGV